MAIVLALLIQSCATTIQPPSAPQAVSGGINTHQAELAWAHTLKQFVDWQGQVDFKSLAEQPESLNLYVSYLAQISPEKNPKQFATREQRLAYYLNSYNALAMYGVIHAGIPTDFDSISDRAKFFIFTNFILGGKEISLYDYENKIIRPLNEPRVHFALNCMVRACPRLPQAPFEASTVDESLSALTREFVNSSKHVQIIRSSGIVRISEIFKFYTEDFIGPGKADSLIAYINQYRNEPIDEKLKMEFIDYDWTINAQ